FISLSENDDLVCIEISPPLGCRYLHVADEFQRGREGVVVLSKE
ncbi:Uncharacterized protein APZ42_016226, partial [Daphnia magna]